VLQRESVTAPQTPLIATGRSASRTS
jgi:hypothetical protein